MYSFGTGCVGGLVATEPSAPTASHMERRCGVWRHNLIRKRKTKEGERSKRKRETEKRPVKRPVSSK